MERDGNRLRAAFWVKAHIRRCHVAGATAVVARHGFDIAGSILIKVNCLNDTCYVLSSSTSMDGNRIWMRATGEARVPEAEADAYIARQIGFDPDLWVLEIEDREGRHFLDEPVA